MTLVLRHNMRGGNGLDAREYPSFSQDARFDRLSYRLAANLQDFFASAMRSPVHLLERFATNHFEESLFDHVL
jgi:hypothetical protein